jgi:deoxyribodipyrimidine photo-lyase
LHTQGKSYLARPSNIEQYTDGRFQVTTPLATEALDLSDGYSKPPLQALTRHPPLPTDGRIGLLIHEEDLSSAEWIAAQAELSACAGLMPLAAYEAHGIAREVIDFRKDCMRSMLPAESPIYTDIESVLRWATSAQLETVILSEPPVGIWNAVVPPLQAALAKHGIQLQMTRHWWDEHFYPHAQAGFFKLKKAIPQAIKHL